MKIFTFSTLACLLFCSCGAPSEDLKEILAENQQHEDTHAVTHAESLFVQISEEAEAEAEMDEEAVISQLRPEALEAHTKLREKIAINRGKMANICSQAKSKAVKKAIFENIKTRRTDLIATLKDETLSQEEKDAKRHEVKEAKKSLFEEYKEKLKDISEQEKECHKNKKESFRAVIEEKKRLMEACLPKGKAEPYVEEEGMEEAEEQEEEPLKGEKGNVKSHEKKQQGKKADLRKPLRDSSQLTEESPEEETAKREAALLSQGCQAGLGGEL